MTLYTLVSSGFNQLKSQNESSSYIIYMYFLKRFFSMFVDLFGRLTVGWLTAKRFPNGLTHPVTKVRPLNDAKTEMRYVCFCVK